VTVDQELTLNHVLDKYGECMRPGMRPDIMARFDALPVSARRELIIKQINKAIVPGETE